MACLLKSDVEIDYAVPGRPGEVMAVDLTIYDVSGRAVRRLVNRIEGPGWRRATWNGCFSDGREAPSDVYFLAMVAGDARVVRKVALVR